MVVVAVDQHDLGVRLLELLCGADAGEAASEDEHAWTVGAHARIPHDELVALAGLEHEQAVPRPKCVRRAGHRLDREASPGDVRKRISGEELQVAVALVEPEEKRPLVFGVEELDAREAVVVALEVGEGVVEFRRADRPRPPEVVLGALDGLRADRDPAVVRLQHGSAGCAQDQLVDGLRADGQVRVHAEPVRAGLGSDVGGGRSHAKAVLRERVLDSERERERIPGLRMQRVLEHDAVGRVLGGGPGRPADESVDRVSRRGPR